MTHATKSCYIFLLALPALVLAERLSAEATLDGPAPLLGKFALWDANTPLPNAEALTYPAGTIDVLVHRADEQYQFLHDNAITWHNNTLYAAWYNCPKGEIQDASCIRSRHSTDGGKTWSPVQVIASDTRGTGTHYVPVSFLPHRQGLFAYVSNMIGHDLVTRCEVFALDAKEGTWCSRGYISGPFLPNCPPLRMDDGNYLMAGRMTYQAGTTPEIPAVAISQGENFTGAWTLVPMMQHRARPYTDYPESTAWLDGAKLTAVVRGRLAFTSADFGRSWLGPYRHNLPAEDSKPFALKLSTGQRCFLWNYPSNSGKIRQTLNIAVSRPGEEKLRAMWKIRDGALETLDAGPEWSYPCAIEHNGALYAIYTSEKRHSMLSIIPVESLRAE